MHKLIKGKRKINYRETHVFTFPSYGEVLLFKNTYFENDKEIN